MKSVRKSISRRASKTGLMSSREKANNAAMGASMEGTDAPDDLSQLLRLEESEILRCLKARRELRAAPVAVASASARAGERA